MRAASGFDGGVILVGGDFYSLILLLVSPAYDYLLPGVYIEDMSIYSFYWSGLFLAILLFISWDFNPTFLNESMLIYWAGSTVFSGCNLMLLSMLLSLVLILTFASIFTFF